MNSLQSAPSVAHVLGHYETVQRVDQVESLQGAGGFSGARLWKITTAEGHWCLRRWPSTHPREDRLRLIHDVLRRLVAGGFSLVPAPQLTSERTTFVAHAGCFWELVPWMPGQADVDRHPTDARLRAAMEALAEFHRRTGEGFPIRRGYSAGLEDRQRRFGRMRTGHRQRLAAAVARCAWAELRERGRRVLEHWDRQSAAAADLLAGAAGEVPLQVCIRDIWRDHVLFAGEEVSGLIDFGAMNFEHVAADLARLLGSLVGNDQRRWEFALDTYSRTRPLSPEDRQLVPVFDRSSLLLSGIQWLEWICLEGRSFEQPQRVLARLDELLARLESE